MKPSKSKKSSPKNDKSKDLSAEAFDRRAAELTELLKACRDLSDILNPNELYATLAGIIRNKFGISKLVLEINLGFPNWVCLSMIRKKRPSSSFSVMVWGN
jgi:hypothetical protein